MYLKNVHLHTQAEDSLRHYALVTRCSFQGNGRRPACVLSGGSVSDVSAFQWKCLHDAEFAPPVNHSATSKPGSSPLNTHMCDLNSLSQQPGPPSLEQWWPRANGLGVDSCGATTHFRFCSALPLWARSLEVPHHFLRCRMENYPWLLGVV